MKQLKFETAEAAAAACEAINVNRRTKLAAYRVEAEGAAPFFTIGRNANEARGNAATVLNIRVAPADTMSALERLLAMSPEDLLRLRDVLAAINLDAFREGKP